MCGANRSFNISDETARVWRHNLRVWNYDRGDGPSHFAQPVEWDAWNFDGRGPTVRRMIRI